MSSAAKPVAPTVSAFPPAQPADSTEARRQRGLAIAAVTRIKQEHGAWIVPSQSGTGRHLVSPTADGFRCSCPDYEKREQPCKHVFAVEFARLREANPECVPEIPETIALPSRTCAPRPTYKQDWSAYNAAQIHEKAKFQDLLADLCRGLLDPARPHDGAKGGRPPIPMADRVFAVAFKVYTTVSGRRASSDMRDAQGKGHLSRSPHYSRVSRFLEDPAMTPILMGLIGESARPLRSIERDFIADSSGFATNRFVRWFDHKYGVVRKKYDWVKVSVMTGVKTNVITAVEIDERYAADCPRFAALMNATAKNFAIREVSADAAYMSYENMDLVASHGGTPYIAFKANATADRGGTMARMFHLYNFNREDYLAHYHKRSNVESTFSMMKAKFGDGLRSKTDAAMVNESLAKCLCHNVCCLIQSMYELGITATFWRTAVHSEGEGKLTEEIESLERFLWI